MLYNRRERVMASSHCASLLMFRFYLLISAVSFVVSNDKRSREDEEEEDEEEEKEAKP